MEGRGYVSKLLAVPPIKSGNPRGGYVTDTTDTDRIWSNLVASVQATDNLIDLSPADIFKDAPICGEDVPLFNVSNSACFLSSMSHRLATESSIMLVVGYLCNAHNL